MKPNDQWNIRKVAVNAGPICAIFRPLDDIERTRAMMVCERSAHSVGKRRARCNNGGHRYTGVDDPLVAIASTKDIDLMSPLCEHS
jgi:hypothetical protein